MKLSFSTRNVSAESFLSLCNKTAQYRFSGFEVYDAALEKAARENKAVTFFSHAILSEAKTVHMAAATLEAMLEKAAELGMMIAGFSELP